LNLLELKNKSKSKKYILSYLPKNLADLIGDDKKVLYKEKLLKTAYLVDIVNILLKKCYYIDKTAFNLDSRILRERYGTFYNFYVNYLLDNDIIKLQSNYCTGKKSKTYLILPKTLLDVITIKNSDTILLKKYRKFFTVNYLRSLNYKFISLDLMVKVVENLDRVTINYVDANEYIDSLPLTKNQLTKNTHSIKCVKHNDMWFKFDRYGRFHSNLTTIKSGVRDKFLLIDGSPTKEIDIINSQPIFLTYLMSENLDMVDQEEYEFFKQLVINGKLYIYMSHNTNISSRKEVKKLMYTVFFGTNHLNKKENKIFNRLFPSIFSFIKTYKKEKENYKSLAYELQRSESNFLFNIILEEVSEKYPDLIFFTVHDSITVKIEDYDKVKSIFDYNIKKLHKNL
tara:strand:+ start:58636 stop:59829 length:1194 start_codon:yes stop_codon:yes gene_type:complete